MLLVPSFGVCSYFAMGDSCNFHDYAIPDVGMAPLPGVAGTLAASLAKHLPYTGTPTGPALQGAVDYAQTWAMSHPGHVVVAVLVTDGEANECPPTDQASIAAIAATALAATPSVSTFTIGVFAPPDVPSGPDLLDAIAAAGGTGQAFVIDTSQNVSQAFLMALDALRGSALGCQYAIPVPEAGMPDFGKVNVQYTPGGGGMPVEFDHYGGAAQCPSNGDGWYYDDNASPTQILLCPSTCTKVSGDGTGKLEILLGCDTVVPT